MNFDGAKGYMVGNENEGLAGMFVMMNYERLSMGFKALARQNLLIRMQHSMRPTVYRAASTGAKSPENQPIQFWYMVMYAACRWNVRANNEASRAFAVYVWQQLDITKYSTDPEAVRKATDRVALLTPIAKSLSHR